MRQKLRNEIYEMVLETIEDYALTEAKKLVEERNAKRDKRVADLISALGVLPEQTPVRSALENELGMLLSSGQPTILSGAELEKMLKETKEEPVSDDAKGSPYLKTTDDHRYL